MALHLRSFFAVLALLAGSAAIGDGPARAQSAASGTAANSAATPTPVRPEFTRPGGIPGAARQTGEPERFWDPAQAQKKKKKNK